MNIYGYMYIQQGTRVLGQAFWDLADKNGMCLDTSYHGTKGNLTAVSPSGWKTERPGFLSGNGRISNVSESTN